MAYMSQDKKKAIAAKLKTALKGSGLKYSLSVHHHTSLVMTIAKGPVDFIQNYRDTISDKPWYNRFAGVESLTTYMQVNDFHYQDQFSGRALELLQTIIPILNDGNHDNSDYQTDYFDVGWYLSVHIGRWNKPYQVI